VASCSDELDDDSVEQTEASRDAGSLNGSWVSAEDARRGRENGLSMAVCLTLLIDGSR
jgi:hypothetical protein